MKTMVMEWLASRLPRPAALGAVPEINFLRGVGRMQGALVTRDIASETPGTAASKKVKAGGTCAGER
jgi:hypothetical protein